MRFLVSKIINNNYTINLLLIISMTQMFSLFKFFYMPLIKEGDFNFSLITIGSMGLNILFIILLIRLIIKDLKDDSFFSFNLFGYTIITIVTLYILKDLIEKDPNQTLLNILKSGDYIYNIIFNKLFYIVDICIISLIYIFRLNKKTFSILLNLLVYKICFLLSIYMMSISYINIHNSIYKEDNGNAFILDSYSCNETYTKANLFFIETLDCPLRKK